MRVAWLLDFSAVGGKFSGKFDLNAGGGVLTSAVTIQFDLRGDNVGTGIDAETIKVDITNQRT